MKWITAVLIFLVLGLVALVWITLASQHHRDQSADRCYRRGGVPVKVYQTSSSWQAHVLCINKSAVLP